MIEKNKSENISVEDLNKSLGTEYSPVVVDVRTCFEYKSGHIPGAINIPFWKTLFVGSKIEADKDSLLVLTCAHGPRAKAAKFFLKLIGFQHVVYLNGHMVAWKNAKLPLE